MTLLRQESRPPYSNRERLIVLDALWRALAVIVFVGGTATALALDVSDATYFTLWGMFSFGCVFGYVGRLIDERLRP